MPEALISSEEKRNIRRDQIALIVHKYYEKFEFLRYEPLELLTEKAIEMFLDTELSIEEINEKILEAVYDRKRDIEDRYDDDKVRTNHETVYGLLETLVRKLNQAGVDYQLAGALCGYIKYGEESDRCHDDIDLTVNEADLPKFRKICLDLGLFYEDNRLNSPRVLKDGVPSGVHEVIAKDTNSGIHVGVFCFERLPDNTIILKGYYHDEDNNPCVREEIYGPDFTDLVFNHEEVDFRGTPVRIISPEFVYSIKEKSKKDKDQHDRDFLSSRINKRKYDLIKKIGKEEAIVQCVPVSEEELIHEDDSLGMMLDEAAQDDVVEDKQTQKEGNKVLVKTDSTKASEGGFISNIFITTIALIGITVISIIATIIYFFNI